MNWEHLSAFLWLRWRILVNQWRRSGKVNAILMTILAVVLAIMAIPLLAGCFLIGMSTFPKAAPLDLLYTWDAMIVAFMFFWGIGLVAELQRTEILSLSKFMHLPVSVKGAFVINYVSSLLRLSLIFFVPILFGFGLALAVRKGGLLLFVLPLTVAFLLMVTALTYQFQGWLASLMSNPRRRRTVVVVTTALFVLMAQVPNLLNMFGLRSAQQQVNQASKLSDDWDALEQAYRSGQIDEQEHLRRQRELMQRFDLAKNSRDLQGTRQLEPSARLLNLILPIGWLPLGVMTAAEGKVLPALLAFLGMTLIGSAGLWRSYRTTVGLYQGRYTLRKGTPAPTAAAPVATGKPAANRLESHIPGLSEPVSAIALAGVRSLIRSPESKMMLLTSVIMEIAFGSMLLRSSSGMSESMRTLVAIGAIALSLFGVMQLMANQFGFDRDGFRVFVLSAASRRDILLGKNLAFAPWVAAMAAILVIIVQVVCPLRWDHFLSMLPQAVSMFLLFCILSNLLSVYAPMYIAAGSLKPAQPKLLTVLLQMAMVFCLFPLIQTPTLLPLAVETGLAWLGWIDRAPICLVLSIVECAAVVFIYRGVLNWQGNLLRAGEQRILDVVTNRAA